MCGICTSMKIRSKVCRFRISSASQPFSAWVTTIPRFLMTREITSTTQAKTSLGTMSARMRGCSAQTVGLDSVLAVMMPESLRTKGRRNERFQHLDETHGNGRHGKPDKKGCAVIACAPSNGNFEQIG
jgi:hypothetical protein